MQKLLKYENLFERKGSFDVNAFEVIELSDAADKINKMYKNKFNIDKYLKNPICKGLTQRNQIIDASSCSLIFNKYKTPRISPNAYNNFYNIFLSNHESWKKYPKRDMSLVCSSSLDGAVKYGGSIGSFYVIPEPGEQIGCCPDDDIWNSFKAIKPIDTLCRFIEKCIQLLKEDADKITASWKDTEKILKQISEFSKSDLFVSREEFIIPVYFNCISSIYNEENIDLEDRLSKMLDPSKNGFEIVKYPSMLPSSSEVWFEGSAILVNSRHIEGLRNYL